MALKDFLRELIGGDLYILSASDVNEDIDFRKKHEPRMTRVPRMKYLIGKACHRIIALVALRDLLPIN